MLRARWRGRLAAGIAALAVCVISLGMLASPARADTYTSYLVQQLRHDPVYISSYSSAAQPGDAARLKRILSRVPLKTYVIADTAAGPDGDLQDSDLAAVLHDQLGGGLFIMARTVDDPSATGFGTSLPVGDAMDAATFQLPGYPTLTEVTQRFVSILMSGKTEQQLKAAEHAVGQRDKKDEAAPPEDEGTPAWQVLSATAGGAVLGGGAVLALVRWRRRSRLTRRRITPGPGAAGVLGIAGLLALAPASVTHAALEHSGTAPAPPPQGPATAARGLSSSPVYVDPAMTWALTPAAGKRLTAAVKASPVPVYVAALPLSTDEDGDDGGAYIADQVHSRLRRDGVYLVIGPSGDIYDAEFGVRRDIDLPLDTAYLAHDMPDSQIAAGLPGRVVALVSAIDRSPADQDPFPGSQPSPGEFSGGRAASDDQLSSGDDDSAADSTAASDMATGGVLGLVIAGPLLAALGLGVARATRRSAARRRGWGDDGDAGTPVEPVPAAPSDGWLRRHAAGELAELERLIDSAGETNPGWERALDDYDAGRLAASGEAEPVDLAGAIVLARDGRMALEQRLERPPAPCLVNPLHGRATESVPVRSLGLGLGAEYALKKAGRINVCESCERATVSRRRERALKLRHDGTAMGYLDFNSVWRKRLFGATGPGLPQAVREHLHVS